jgi:hypothetical protein
MLGLGLALLSSLALVLATVIAIGGPTSGALQGANIPKDEVRQPFVSVPISQVEQLEVVGTARASSATLKPLTWT